PQAFIRTIVSQCSSKILREKQAAKRDPRRLLSLNRIIDCEGDHPVAAADLLDERMRNSRRGHCPRDPETLAQLVSDVADVISKLREEHRALAELLKCQTVAEIAKQNGIPRSTLDDRVRCLRKHFENAQLRKYL